MFLPIGDTPNPVRTPWMTWALIAANVAVYVLVSLPRSQPLTRADLQDPRVEAIVRRILEEQGADRRVEIQQELARMTRYDVFVFEHGYKPAEPQYADLLFSMFLHAGLMHLFGNMLFLWIYGDNVEVRLGSFLYLLCYLATGAVATWSFALMERESSVPLVGASGAISGVLGFYLIWYPRNSIKIFIWLGILFADVILLPASLVLIVYLVLDNLLPLLIGGDGAVAYGAHIGGFIAGAVAALVLRPFLPAPPMQHDRAFERHRRHTQWGRGW